MNKHFLLACCVLYFVVPVLAQGQVLDVGAKAARSTAELTQQVARQAAQARVIPEVAALAPVKIINLLDKPDVPAVALRLAALPGEKINTAHVLPARVLKNAETEKHVFPYGWISNTALVPVPWKYSKEEFLYRGIRLHHLGELKNILENGLETSKSYLSKIYATSQLSMALWYSLLGDNAALEFPLVIKMPLPGELVEKRPCADASVWVFEQDIAASRLIDVMVFLEVNGEKGWYKAVLQDGEIVLRPVFGSLINW